MTAKITVRYAVQYCRDGWDITGEFHRETDADVVRFWEGDFCLIEVTREGGAWVPTGGDGMWVELAERQFGEPHAALAAHFPADRYSLVEDQS